MAEILKNKTLDFNDYNFNDYFNVENFYNFEKLYITKDLSNFNEKLLIIDKNGDINLETSNYKALSEIMKINYLVIFDLEIVEKLNLQEVILKFNKNIIIKNAKMCNKLNLYKIDNNKKDIVIDKYGNISKI